MRFLIICLRIIFLHLHETPVIFQIEQFLYLLQYLFANTFHIHLMNKAEWYLKEDFGKLI